MIEKKYYWLKLKRDFFKRHDIKIIESMENGEKYLLFYLKLLVESLDHSGNLRFSDTVPYNDKMLSAITGTDIDIVRTAVSVFSELGMMEKQDDGTLFMAQTLALTGSETPWMQKKRDYREKIAQKETITGQLEGQKEDMSDKRLEIRDKSIEIREKKEEEAQDSFFSESELIKQGIESGVTVSVNQPIEFKQPYITPKPIPGYKKEPILYDAFIENPQAGYTENTTEPRQAVATRIELAKGLWNLRGLTPYRYTALQIKPDDMTEIMRTLQAYNDIEIGEAINNYAEISRDKSLELKPSYPSGFIGFMKSGVDKYTSEAKPFERCKKPIMAMTPQEKQEAGIKEARALADKIKRREEERAKLWK